MFGDGFTADAGEVIDFRHDPALGSGISKGAGLVMFGTIASRLIFGGERIQMPTD